MLRFKSFYHRALPNAILITSALFVSLLLAWYTLSACNFFYPVLHDVVGIDATIAEYAPRNSYRKSFDRTTRKQRAELFREIVRGINNHGEGLDTIRYFDAQGQPLGLLLRKPEIVHLGDVARLLDRLQRAALLSGVLLIVMITFYRRRNINIPPAGRVLAAVVLTLLFIAIVVAASGAEKLFYQWHTLVFPAGHQWFFYYEESLMTMLMKAPDLFAWLAVLLALFALAFLYLILRLVQGYLARGRAAPGRE
ncbi:MAG: DUF1461 domain-containing protein [Thiogranum sp.]